MIMMPRTIYTRRSFSTMITQCVIDDYVDAPALTSIVVDTI